MQRAQQQMMQNCYLQQQYTTALQHQATLQQMMAQVSVQQVALQQQQQQQALAHMQQKLQAQQVQPQSQQTAKLLSLTPPSSPKMQRAGHRRIVSDVPFSSMFGVPASRSSQQLAAAAAEANLYKSKSASTSPAGSPKASEQNIYNPPDLSVWNPFGDDNFSKLTVEDLLDKEFAELRNDKTAELEKMPTENLLPELHPSMTPPQTDLFGASPFVSGAGNCTGDNSVSHPSILAPASADSADPFTPTVSSKQTGCENVMSVNLIKHSTLPAVVGCTSEDGIELTCGDMVHFIGRCLSGPITEEHSSDLTPSTGTLHSSDEEGKSDEVINKLEDVESSTLILSDSKLDSNTELSRNCFQNLRDQSENEEEYPAYHISTKSDCELCKIGLLDSPSNIHDNEDLNDFILGDLETNTLSFTSDDLCSDVQSVTGEDVDVFKKAPFVPKNDKIGEDESQIFINAPFKSKTLSTGLGTCSQSVSSVQADAFGHLPFEQIHGKPGSSSVETCHVILSASTNAVEEPVHSPGEGMTYKTRNMGQKDVLNGEQQELVLDEPLEATNLLKSQKPELFSHVHSVLNPFSQNCYFECLDCNNKGNRSNQNQALRDLGQVHSDGIVDMEQLTCPDSFQNMDNDDPFSAAPFPGKVHANIETSASK
ncbi:BMP-2-inducible protein kinase-like isoform X2 [Chiloscyllium plagiosum]|uniref:BMP-2-inducible protein kinase-like isoform X2 n=1 Tax=Chiloscyllium plagiosum TaxID=36176 RepID=UPI001CB847A9|nr:BMP-2-inducible protein kinase-like isoform X2 [Chiloscyllium plagiosum]